ncbi:hypothetical protein [Flavobacterium aquiphilum]|uniref:hypothetical protein n=1 Tax=Flavobacterium aquiphilum TaxID=3003261 RepID=UPI002481839A|nr:hypothetical protein [Flavobacterium aquiphilum]
MKKNVLLLVATLIFHPGLHAQNKQIKELLLQIAALQVHIDYVKKGYTVVKKGLNFIGDVKKGEVNLHSGYFNSLKQVNPKIRKYYKVAEIISLQLKIVKIYKRTREQLRVSDLFHGDELDYIERSFDRLLADCDDVLEVLMEVTLDSKLKMKDDQRIIRIDELYEAMLDNYAFCKSFSEESLGLSFSKVHENEDVKSAQLLHAL